MTWKLTEDGILENITKHNWTREFGGKNLICLEGNQRADATCTGCGARVFAAEFLRVFGPPDYAGGLIAADMADGVHAGLFEEMGVDSTSH